MGVAARWAAWDRFAPRNPAGPLGASGVESAVWPYAPLPVTIEIWLGWWEDITRFVFSRGGGGIDIRYGYPDEGTSPEPGSIEFSLNNGDGRFTSRNPLSPYYGRIGRNTPVRVTVAAPYAGAGRTQFVAEASEWPTRWDVSGRDVWTTVTAQGILRRLGQGSSPLRSVMKSALLSAGSEPLYYWPLEDGTDASSLASGLADGSSIAIIEPDHTFPGTEVRIVGSDPCLSLESWQPDPSGSPNTWNLPQLPSVSLSGITTKISFAFAFTLDTTITAYWEFRVQLTGGTFDHLVFAPYASTTSGVLTSTYGANFTLVNSGTAGGANYASPADSGYPNLWDGEPHTVLCTAEQSGADVLVSMQVDDATLRTATFASTTLGTPVRLQPTIPMYGTISFGGDTGHGENMVIGLAHLAVWGSATPLDLFPYLDSLTGEEAGDRAERLAEQVGTFVDLRGSAQSVAMGPQEIPSTFADAFTETWVADMALVWEHREELGLVWLPRRELYNRSVALTLDYTARGQVAPDLQPVDDDQRTRNDITVTRKNGSSSRAVDTTSSMGTADPPTGVGVVVEQVEINVETDGELFDQAFWRLHVSTWNETRYPAVRVNMAALMATGREDLVAAVASLEPGDRIQLTNLPVWSGAGGTADLMVIGLEKTFVHPTDWDTTLVCVPYGPYRVGVWVDSAAPGSDPSRWGASGCTLAEDLDTTEVDVDVTNTDTVWGSTNLPYDILIGGERMTVTSVLGSSTPQTLTVTRSVNSIVKSHTSGATVALYQPVPYTL